MAARHRSSSMVRTTFRVGVAGALAAGLLACTGPLAQDRVGHGWLQLDGSRIALEVRDCALISGRLIEELPAGGSEVSLIAEGRDGDGQPVRVVVRRGTDVVAPHRFDVLEVAIGEVDGDLEVLVLVRGFDRDTGAWSQIDPDAPGARRDVDGPLIRVDGAGLRARRALGRDGRGQQVPIALEAMCPPVSHADPGLA